MNGGTGTGTGTGAVMRMDKAVGSEHGRRESGIFEHTKREESELS